MVYVADTHALVWYLGGARALGSAAHTAFTTAESGTGTVVIPVIVVAELLMLAEKRRAGVDVAKVIDALTRRQGYELSPLGLNTVLGIGVLTALPDIHDRLIVAETLERGATLITVDQAITASGLVPVVW